MRRHWRSALSLFGVLTALTGLAYPILVTVLAQLAFPFASGGSLDPGGTGSALVGQPFTAPGYFWSRPSATGARPYDATASGGSNLGPTNPALTAAVAERIAALRAVGDSARPVPADLVTASASGLDPHVSPGAAEFQVARVARVRALPVSDVRALVARHVEGRTFGVLGEPRVNVLALNRALDSLARAAEPR